MNEQILVQAFIVAGLGLTTAFGLIALWLHERINGHHWEAVQRRRRRDELARARHQRRLNRINSR